MRRYEYHTETMAGAQLVLVANQRGADGWRVIQIASAAPWMYGQAAVTVLFERERG